MNMNYNVSLPLYFNTFFVDIRNVCYYLLIVSILVKTGLENQDIIWGEIINYLPGSFGIFCTQSSYVEYLLVISKILKIVSLAKQFTVSTFYVYLHIMFEVVLLIYVRNVIM